MGDLHENALRGSKADISVILHGGSVGSGNLAVDYPLAITYHGIRRADSSTKQRTACFESALPGAYGRGFDRCVRFCGSMPARIR